MINTTEGAYVKSLFERLLTTIKRTEKQNGRLAEFVCDAILTSPFLTEDERQMLVGHL